MKHQTGDFNFVARRLDVPYGAVTGRILWCRGMLDDAFGAALLLLMTCYLVSCCTARRMLLCRATMVLTRRSFMRTPDDTNARK